MDLTTATPVEIDTELALLDGKFHQLTFELTGVISHLHTLDNQRAVHRSRTRVEWPKSDGDTVTALHAKLAEGLIEPWNREQAAQYLARRTETLNAVQANRERFDELQGEYDRRPWLRYVSVTGGHIHSGTRCTGGTIRPVTLINWAPSLSGKPVADAVAELGPTLCTHCFPDAPVEWQAGEPKPERCEGSGQGEVPGTYRRQGMTGYGRCRICKINQAVTGRGLIRAHKPKPVES